MGHHNRLMPPTPDADENSTDQPDPLDVGTQPDDTASSDVPSTTPYMEEAEGRPGRDDAEADQVTTDNGENEADSESFPPRGVLTLRALRWGGVLAMFA